MKTKLIAIASILLFHLGISEAAVISQVYALTNNSYYSYEAYDYNEDKVVTDTKSVTGFLQALIDGSNNTVTLDYSFVQMDGGTFRPNENLISNEAGIASGVLTSGFTGEYDYVSYGNATLDPFPFICVECGYEMTLNLNAYTTGNPLALSYHESNPYDTGEKHFELYISEVPLPGAAWLFGSGMLGMLGIFFRKLT